MSPPADLCRDPRGLKQDKTIRCPVRPQTPAEARSSLHRQAKGPGCFMVVLLGWAGGPVPEAPIRSHDGTVLHPVLGLLSLFRRALYLAPTAARPFPAVIRSAAGKGLFRRTRVRPGDVFAPWTSEAFPAEFSSRARAPADSCAGMELDSSLQDFSAGIVPDGRGSCSVPPPVRHPCGID